MPKEELLTIEGVVDEILPDGRFRVLLDNQVRIIAYTAGKMRRYRIRSIVGDRVHVEMTPYDLPKEESYIARRFPGHLRGRGTEVFVGDYVRANQRSGSARSGGTWADAIAAIHHLWRRY